MVATWHVDILPEQQRLLFESLTKQAWMSPFYLAGGTALALHIRHRQSIDFDFFTTDEFDTRRILSMLKTLGTFELFSEAHQTINGLLNQVRISFFHYPYPLIQEPYSYGTLSIAGLQDIGLMKLEAISGRGSKKDFIDLYFLLKMLSLSELFEQYPKKYGIEISNHYHLLKSLVYFDDAESQPMPIMHHPISWNDVKTSIISTMKEYALI